MILGWLGAAGIVVVFGVLAYRSWTAYRMERLHARCEAARSALVAQLVRRATAADALELGEAWEHAVRAALTADPEHREQAENDLTRRLCDLPWTAGDPRLAELIVVTSRMLVARQIYNDAVRDSLALRRRRLPRALGLANHTAAPRYFDIDDSLPGHH